MKLSTFSCVHLFISSRNRLEYRMLHEADECSAQAKASTSGDGHSRTHSHSHEHSHDTHDSHAPRNQTSTSASLPPCPRSYYEADAAAYYATRTTAEPSAYQPLGVNHCSNALSLSPPLKCQTLLLSAHMHSMNVPNEKTIVHMEAYSLSDMRAYKMIKSIVELNIFSR